MTNVMTDVDLTERVSAETGLELTLERLLSDRRGARVLGLTAGRERYALKLSTSEDHAAIRREATVLQDLSDFTAHRYAASGTQKGRAWLLQRWVKGQKLHHRVRDLRAGGDKAGMLELFTAMFTNIAELHALGYLHGDLQPEHFRLGTDGVHLLDLALTHRQTEAFDYGGALVHFSAPETCRRQLAGGPLRYDKRAELYALASVVFFLYTGSLSADYSDGEGLEHKRRAIAAGHRNTFASLDCEPFPALEEVLERCLAFDERRRYAGVAEAARALAARGGEREGRVTDAEIC